MRLYWFLVALILSAALAFFHSVALRDFLYWKFLWLDIPMHFLGGLTIGTFGAALLATRRPLAFVALMVLAFAGWEVFEYLYQVPQPANYSLDTAKDLLMDTLGATTVYAVARYSLWKRR